MLHIKPLQYKLVAIYTYGVINDSLVSYSAIHVNEALGIYGALHTTFYASKP